MALIKINGVHGTQSFATAEDVQTVTNLDNLHDVEIDGTLGNGQYLVYNDVVNQWKNVNTPPVVSALDDLTDVDTTGKLNNYVLTWDNAQGVWEGAPGGHYTDADVDVHLNSSTALSNQVLSWDGTDYDWVTVNSYTDADVDTHLNSITATTNQVLSWSGTDYAWVTNPTGGLQAVVDDVTPQLGGDLDVNTHTIVSTTDDLKLKPADAKQLLIQENTNPQTGGLLKIACDSHNFDNPQLELKNTYADSGRQKYTKSQLRYSNDNDALVDITTRQGNGTKWGIFETMDPLGVHLRYDTDPVPNQLSYPGDYAFVNNFDYTNYTMDTTIYGAHDGYTLKVLGDNNGGVDSYFNKPYKIEAESVSIEPYGNQKLFIDENSTVVHNRLKMKNPAIGGGGSNVAEFWNVSPDSDGPTKTRYGHEDDNTGDTTVHGEIRSVNSSDRKNMVIGINNDNGSGFDYLIAASKHTVNNNEKKVNISGQLKVDVDGQDYTSGIFIENDMTNRSQNFMAGLNTSLNWGAGTVPDGAEIFQDFTVSDDTQGSLQVGFFGSQYSSADDGFLNTMKLTSQQHGISNESTIGVNARNAFTDVPFKYAQYTDTERNALTVDPGTMIYNNTTGKLNYFNGSDWRELSDSAV